MTAHQIQKISIEQLRPGMYVGNVFNDRGILLYSANTMVKTYSQVEALRRQGVTILNINLQKGVASDNPDEADVAEPEQYIAPQQEPEVRTDLYTEAEIRKAQSERTIAIETVRTIMDSAKIGRMFSINSIVSSVETILDHMLDEPELLLNLSRLKTNTGEAYVHSVNVATLVIGFTSALGFPREKILEAGIGAMLHDIGLVCMPEDMFGRQGSFTRQELEGYKKHPIHGLEIIQKNRNTLPDAVHVIVGQHHERLNGMGYPTQCSGEMVNDLAVICGIADTYDTLTTHGMFNRMYLPQEALAHIFQSADEEFPRSLVEHFTKLLGIYPVGTFVKLDTGEMGVVVKNNRSKLLSPSVRILFNKDGARLTTPYIRDLSLPAISPDEQATRVMQSLDPAAVKINVDQFIINNN